MCPRTIQASDRFTALPDDQTLAATVEIHQELPGRIQVVLIRQSVGF